MTLKGVEIIVDRFMAPNTWAWQGNTIITDSMRTIEAQLDSEVLSPMGIEAPKPKYLGELPEFKEWFKVPLQPIKFYER